ncbi:MAG: hypothetical protein IKI31_04055, partial [Treponema sp.]|nr:hypothetical protein [Treponema sp.]
GGGGIYLSLSAKCNITGDTQGQGVRIVGNEAAGGGICCSNIVNINGKVTISNNSTRGHANLGGGGIWIWAGIYSGKSYQGTVTIADSAEVTMEDNTIEKEQTSGSENVLVFKDAVFTPGSWTEIDVARNSEAVSL